MDVNSIRVCKSWIEAGLIGTPGIYYILRPMGSNVQESRSWSRLAEM